LSKYRVKPWTSCGFFILSRIFTTTNSSNDYKSSHTMAPSHSGFFLFYHCNLQGSYLRTVIQPLAETAGLLISWVFSFYHEPYQPQRINKWGSRFRPPPWSESLILTVHGLGLSPPRHTYGSESVPIVQGPVYDLNVYKTHGE